MLDLLNQIISFNSDNFEYKWKETTYNSKTLDLLHRTISYNCAILDMVINGKKKRSKTEKWIKRVPCHSFVT